MEILMLLMPVILVGLVLWLLSKMPIPSPFKEVISVVGILWLIFWLIKHWGAIVG